MTGISLGAIQGDLKIRGEKGDLSGTSRTQATDPSSNLTWSFSNVDDVIRVASRTSHKISCTYGMSVPRLQSQETGVTQSRNSLPTFLLFSTKESWQPWLERDPPPLT